MHLAWAALLLAVPWPTQEGSGPLADRLPPPAGFVRRAAEPGSFGAWLRQLPTKPGRPPVHLFDGRVKPNQRAQHLVLDVDVGDRDLQQCADAVMRLFAEWQWSAKQRDQICFRYTSGDAIDWSKWRQGYRPRVRGSKVTFKKRSKKDGRYRSFRNYLTSIFTYAGTASLQKDLTRVADPTQIEIGDVFIQGGFPGHAVLVVDVVEDDAGRRMFALAQSFMPAQEIHVLRNPAASSPWYMAKKKGELRTPEWAFRFSDLRRFGASGCP